MSKTRLLWIGCLESEEEFKIKSRKGYNLASAQVSQYNILTGLEEATGLVFDSINGSVLPPYPTYKDRVVEEVKWSHKEGAFDISVGYKNEKFINRVTCKYSMIESARNWVNGRYKGEDLIVFVYSMRTPVMATACEIKKLIPSAKIYLIVTDLPQFMDLGESKVKAFLKKIDFAQIKNMQKKFDGFILYASKMAEFLRIPNGKWILMEGLYDELEIPNYKKSIEKKEHEKQAIMYSGKLDRQYGIDMLLDAFMRIDNSHLELWFTGGGNAEEYIRECALKDSRIKFYGFLPSRKEVLKKQQDATLLINMRLPSENASAYSFPSKLFEYMATGIPVLSFNLEGIPNEYHKYLIIVAEEKEESLIEAIESTLTMNNIERINKGNQAREFIISQKNKYSQAKYIYEWIQRK
ncbi:glycosyltransferase [Priestia sp. SIMBA_032]|uniref:glycosyltransferase n=1 Tax=Priestia sp. SIMBA_032 TaxID=3085775 RepID=UPI003979BA6E